MSIDKLRVAFLWHFHQPVYKDLLTSEYLMPWVRLHALKDYYDMGAILASVPGAKATFNFVPCLLDQLDDYAQGRANDLFVRLTAKPAATLDQDERSFMLRNFFYVNRRIIADYPRFSELLSKRDLALASNSNRSALKAEDFLDLQVLFNLAWCGNSLRRESEVVRTLEAKGRSFDEDDKAALLEVQQAFLSRVTPLYSRLASEGKAELTTTPFYHPILPLVANVENALECMPGVPLPAKWKGVVEDARRHASDAAQLFQRTFGAPLRGMWPAEGSVSQDTCGIYTDLGVKWIATDEAILGRSLAACQVGNLGSNRCLLYRPYFVEVGGKKLSVFFRDHQLSDAIGFVYSPWGFEAAVEDFISRLRSILEMAQGCADSVFTEAPPIVSVILDGENAWQFYADDGEPFLTELYSRLVETEWIDLVAFSDYLAEFGEGHPLCRLASGSWIRGDFGVWIGHPEDNQAWDQVAKAREALVENPASDPKSKELAWRSLFVAEGSDWNWWYGDDHTCDNIDQFDKLFRRHVANIYTAIGKEPPSELEKPIKALGPVRFVSQPRQFLHPVLDGKDTNYFEWISAGVFDQQSAGRGAMHHVSTVVKKLYFGFDLKMLYLRIDFSRLAREIFEADSGIEMIVQTILPAQFRIRIVREGRTGPRLDVLSLREGEWVSVATLDTVAIDHVIEMAIPFEVIGCKRGDRLQFSAKLLRKDQVVESIPEEAAIETTIPSPEFEQEQWYV